MTLTLMYVTHEPAVAAIAQAAGVDWIFVDLEILGKHDRQGHLDTVISGHSVADVIAVRAVLDHSRLLVRVNPLNPASEAEIDSVIDAGADIVMLPFFTEVHEVSDFISYVAGRAQTCLLLETPQAVAVLDGVLGVPGIDYVHIGLNDLHLGYGLPFMFNLLADGTVERICRAVARRGIPFGFGGIARLGLGELPAEAIITEHHRLGSSMTILSRSFCRADEHDSDLAALAQLFAEEVGKIRAFESSLVQQDRGFFEANRHFVVRTTAEISARRTTAASALSSEPQVSTVRP